MELDLKELEILKRGIEVWNNEIGYGNYNLGLLYWKNEKRKEIGHLNEKEIVIEINKLIWKLERVIENEH